MDVSGAASAAFTCDTSPGLAIIIASALDHFLMSAILEVFCLLRLSPQSAVLSLVPGTSVDDL